jgi:hypothetical protein
MKTMLIVVRAFNIFASLRPLDVDEDVVDQATPQQEEIRKSCSV